MRTKDAVHLLLEADLLRGVPAGVLRGLTPPPEAVTVTSGETLIQEGEQGHAYFLLVRGRLRAFARRPEGGNRVLGDILPGEGVGEMSLLTDEPTAATVRAVHDSEIVRFSRASYLEMMHSSPEAALAVARAVIRRLRARPDGGIKAIPYKRIAVLPIGEAVDITAFNARLTDQLGRQASTTRLSVESLGPELAPLAAQRNSLAASAAAAAERRLEELEGGHGLVLMACDDAPTEWTRLCLARADLVLLVAAAGGDGMLSDTETRFLAGLDPDLAARMDLVLVHDDDWHLTPGAENWLQARRIAEHHHVRRAVDEDFARLARKLTGRAIGVVLDGGGARGFAQIGILQAFEEAGLPIDRIAGVGIGAVIAGLYAAGNNPKQIAAICREIWLKGRPLTEYTFPALSVIRGRRLRILFHNAFQGWRIENLPIGFFCVSGNLTRTDAAVHDRGPLWKAIAASNSIVGAGPPVFWDGDVLVDGEVVANVAGDTMRQRFKGLVVECDVSANEPLSVARDMVEAPSGWSILLRRLLPVGEPLAVPGLFEVMARTATLNGRRLAKLGRPLADLTVAPDMGHFTETDFDALDEIVQLGRARAIAVLAAAVGALGGLVDRTRLADPASLPDNDMLFARYHERRATERKTRRKRTLVGAAAAVFIIGAVMVLRGDHIRIANAVGGLWSGFREAAGPKGGLGGAKSSTVAARRHEGANLLPVQAVTLQARDGFEVTENYAGRIVSRRASDISFEQTGLLVAVLVQDGDRVTAGQDLARIDTRQLEARRRELEAELKHQKALRDQTKARLDLARITEKRRSELLRQNNVSRQLYDQSLFEERALASEMNASMAAIEQAAAALDRVEVDLSKAVVKAPFDGVVVDRLVHEGTVVSPGTPVLRLIEAGIKEVRVGVPAHAADALRPGTTYQVEVNGRIVQATLQAVLPSLNAETRTVPLVLSLPDPDMAFQNGQLARLQLARTVTMNGFWVPATALIGGRRGLWNAYALEDLGSDGLKSISLREVQALHSEGDRLFVRGTLKDGDRLVATGLHRLVPGQIVHLVDGK